MPQLWHPKFHVLKMNLQPTTAKLVPLQYKIYLTFQQVVEALSGVVVTKVVCGSQFSMALTAIAQVYTWGTGPCLGQVSITISITRSITRSITL